MTSKSSKSTNPGPVYQKAGESLTGHPWSLLKNLEASINSSDDVTRIDIVGLLTNVGRAFQLARRVQPRLYRVFIPANDLYDLTIEIMQELLFLVSAEHRRSSKQNVDVKFSKDEIDELGNIRSWTVRPKEIMVNADAFEFKVLEFILENLVSLKRNRRPLRSFQMPSQALENNPEQDKQKKRRKRYLYTRKEIKEAEGFYNSLQAKDLNRVKTVRPRTVKVHTTEKWYYYITGKKG